MIDIQYLKSILSYSEQTGQFTWLESRGTVSCGTIAGAVHTDKGRSYRIIKIDKRGYKAHILAWFYMNGVWPSRRLDHKDNDSLNNRVSNLRFASHSQNMANRKLNKNNSCGFKGVIQKNGRFFAYINKDGQRQWLGGHDTPEAASAARASKAQEIHGEFARSA